MSAEWNRAVTIYVSQVFHEHPHRIVPRLGRMSNAVFAAKKLVSFFINKIDLSHTVTDAFSLAGNPHMRKRQIEID